MSARDPVSEQSGRTPQSAGRSAGGTRKNRYRQRIEELLHGSDVQINGERPWDIQVHDRRFFRRVLAQGSLGLGESYMDGLWDCEQLDEMISRVVRNGIDRKVIGRAMLFDLARARLLNLQRGRRAFTVGERHYDIGNDLYERMLDSRMIYSCGYWKEARTLDEAQEAKLDLTARKLGLEPGMRVLDIGCGWGGTARFLAERYGCDVVGVTVSREQVAYAREHGGGPAPPTAAAPAGSVEIRLQDYRDISEEFDRVVSIGMFEHVGVKNYPTFMDVVRRVLRRDGLCLLHTIGSNRSVSGNDPWLDRYIFPNSMLPSIKQIAQAAEGRFVVEDWHNFGVYYDTTLLHWDENFRAAWPELAERYGERFYRMWRYFLLSSAGGFRARKNQLWQVVLSPEGVPGGYRSVR